MLEFCGWLEERGWLKDAIFQQDGAPAHTAILSVALLKQLFGENIISLTHKKKMIRKIIRLHGQRPVRI